jgi:hypothetical protein
MRRTGAVLALAGAAALLSGCVYDPYTGGYYPCCNYYGAPYYRYPPPAYYPPPPNYGPGPAGGPPPTYGSAPTGGPPPNYGSGPAGGPPPGQMQGGPYQSQPLSPPPGPGASAQPGGGSALAQRFAMANVTHDGRLTLQQAQSAMPMVARNFDSIDVEHKGYVTLPEIRAFAAERRTAGESATE